MEGIIATFIFIVIIGFFVEAFKGGAKTAALSAELKSAQEKGLVFVQPAPGLFDANAIPYPDRTPPKVEGLWRTMKEDHSALHGYADYLDSLKKEVDTAAQAAFDRFKADNARLSTQQRNLVTRAKKCRRQLSIFKELPKRLSGATSNPFTHELAIPVAPKAVTPSDIATRYGLLPFGANLGHVVSQSVPRIAQAGMSSGNPIAALAFAAVGSAVLAVRAKSMVSAATRAIEEAYGKTQSFCVDVKASVALLGRAHEEAVAVSQRLTRAEGEVAALEADVAAIGKRTRRLSQLSADDRAKVDRLFFWVLCAEQSARQTV